eukprot:6186707-Pleurochrysis_carterae.AAC.1
MGQVGLNWHMGATKHDDKLRYFPKAGHQEVVTAIYDDGRKNWTPLAPRSDETGRQLYFALCQMTWAFYMGCGVLQVVVSATPYRTHSYLGIL